MLRGILRIDPELVIVVAAGRAAHDRDCLAAVLRAVQRDVRHVDDIGILGSMVMPLKYQARLVRRGSALASVQVSPPSSER